jgi:DNA gyrase subunit A
MVVLHHGTTLLVVTEHGMGKRTEVDEYRMQRRGGKGVINVRTTPKTGQVIAIKEVVPGDELMIITRSGVVNRQGTDAIRVIGRNTQGVRLINLDEGDSVVDVARLANVDEEAEENAEAQLEPVSEPTSSGDALTDELLEEAGEE